MKIVILPAARDDLADGLRFYEHQQEGLGGYFLESLFSDIDSLHLYAGIHRKVFANHRLLSKRFLTPFTTPRKREPCLSKPCWTVAGTRVFTGESFIRPISEFRADGVLHVVSG
jgi:hypothetical protein